MRELRARRIQLEGLALAKLAVECAKWTQDESTQRLESKLDKTTTRRRLSRTRLQRTSDGLVMLKRKWAPKLPLFWPLVHLLLLNLVAIVCSLESRARAKPARRREREREEAAEAAEAAAAEARGDASQSERPLDLGNQVYRAQQRANEAANVASVACESHSRRRRCHCERREQAERSKRPGKNASPAASAAGMPAESGRPAVVGVGAGA